MSHAKSRKCAECIWVNQCSDDDPCEDHTPGGDELELTYYEQDLKERAEAYAEVVEEYSDGG